MSIKTVEFLRSYFRQAIPFILTICLARIFEYIAIASKVFIADAYRYELAGLRFDLWSSLIYCTILMLLYLPLYWINRRLSHVFFNTVNVIMIFLYIALLVVYSERNHPFDHEFFTRSFSDSWTTSKQMLTSGFKLYLPFIAYIGLYFVLYFLIFKKTVLHKYLVIVLSGICIIATCTSFLSMPLQSRFALPGGYYLESNKFTYWITDSYRYLTTKDQFNANQLNDKELLSEIEYYQKEQPFEFTSTEYPLMHKDNSKDVLGSFFKLNSTPPNIVILVVEGLSRDFSGANAYASSFTPFLDSLSGKSLVWDNYLSTAPGTFAAHPAISGSLPYGTKGFSVLPTMPDHLSLIKILKLNGYFTNFMIGFNPDFDNMGGYIKQQGTDFVLLKYPAKYKEMGIGPHGWGMGYPDDALYQRSFEVMDSLHKTPYLNIYHTGTTHEPYLFEQSDIYGKLFDEKMKTVPVTADIKRTLRECKQVLITYMFSDDCIKKFFSDYAKRAEFSNTIFFITGDHHIGSFPSTGNIDDYHVPLIIYSPMLKAPKKFYSINSHNNLTPTITAMLFNNYKMPYMPEEVHWMGDVIDTCARFRNIHSMPFMLWSREISDYIYKDYMISEGNLYKITPDLLEEPYTNDSIKVHITRLLENFKHINSYVCGFNKIYPAKKIPPSLEKINH